MSPALARRLVVQPVPAPGLRGQVAEMVAAGLLVDLARRPLVLRPCLTCSGSTLGETCPQALPCPTCQRGAGGPCVRPSGHVLSGGFGGAHDTRKAAAESVDRARELAGDPTLPARWPSASSTRVDVDRRATQTRQPSLLEEVV